MNPIGDKGLELLSLGLEHNKTLIALYLGNSTFHNLKVLLKLDI